MKRSEPGYMAGYMARQRERLKEAGGKRINVDLTAEAVVALHQLRERGVRSDAAAVNAAVIAYEQLHDCIEVEDGMPVAIHTSRLASQLFTGRLRVVR